MQTRKFVKAAILASAISLVPLDDAKAHGSGGGEMEPGKMGQSYGHGHGMAPGMMGQGYGYGMGSGMMGQGYGYGMGPGMMRPGMMGPGMMNMMHGMMMGPGMMGPGMMRQGYGMGPGMMGQGYGMGPGMMGTPSGREMSEDDVRGFLDRHLEMRGLERLKIGAIDATDERVFKADIVTKDESLVVRVVVDRRTGFPIAFE